ANGVGLDTLASVATLLGALAKAGYPIGDAPRTPEALMARLTGGPTNRLADRGDGGEALPDADYRALWDALPWAVREQVETRWGADAEDPFRAPDGNFMLSLHRFGNIAIGIQPARGYNVDPKESYHAPDLVPPHNYFAFYAWLRDVFR